MRGFKKTTALCLAVLLLAAAGCAPTVTQPTAPATVAITDGGETEYVIIKPLSMSDATKNAVKDLSDWIRNQTGARIKTAFFLPEGQTRQIVIGLVSEWSDRYEELKKLSEADWEISLRDGGDTLLVTAGGGDSLREALDWLKKESLSEGNMKVKADMNQKYCAAPVIKSLSPADGTHYADCDRPSFRLRYVSGYGLETCSAVVDGGAISCDATTDGVVTGAMPGLTAGEHTLTVVLTDKGGQSTTASASFTLTGTGLNAYRGEIHSHTVESDGQGTMQDAYDFVKGKGVMDFFCTTDHNYYYTDEYYQRVQVTTADANYEEGKFVSFYGQEYTSRVEDGLVGHLNVYNTPHVYSGVRLHLPDLYEALVADPDAFGQFNHPGQSWGDFDDFRYNEAADEKMCLFEFQQGEGALYEERFVYALSRGWHLSPTHNEDNHVKNWTESNPHHTVIMASALTRQDLINAIRLNRTYVTNDRTLLIDYRINGEVLGSRLTAPEKLHVVVTLDTEREQGLGKVTLVGEDGVVVAAQECGRAKHFVWELTLDPEEDYYYVKINSNGVWAITAPIWIEQADGLTVADITQAKSGAYDLMRTTVTNGTGSALHDVKATFWVDAPDELKENTTPQRIVTIGDLAVGQTAELTGQVSLTRSSQNRVVCVVTGTDEAGRRHSATTTARLQPLIITETAFVSQSAKYNFIELYNNTNEEIRETNLWLVMMNVAGLFGRGYGDKNIPIRDVVLPAFSPVVIWVKKPGNELTAADFNAHYGTSLTEGRDLFIVESELEPYYNGAPVEWAITTSNGYELLGAHWNYDTQRVKQSQPGTSMQYALPVGPSRYLTAVGVNSEPTPGILLPGQVPEVMK